MDFLPPSAPNLVFQRDTYMAYTFIRTHYVTFGFTVLHLVAAQISGYTKWI